MITETSRTTQERQEITLHLALDLPPEPIPYTRSGRKWRPRAVSARVSRSRVDGGAWSKWTLENSSAVRGLNVKADGTDGADRSSRLWDFADTHPIREHLKAVLEAMSDPAVS